MSEVGVVSVRCNACQWRLVAHLTDESGVIAYLDDDGRTIIARDGIDDDTVLHECPVRPRALVDVE